MSKTNSAAAVFSVLEFSKRFTSNTKDPVRECCEFLAKLKVDPADAGVIKDSSGGMIWFTNSGIQRLNAHIRGLGLGDGALVTPTFSPSSSNSPGLSHSPTTHTKTTSAIKIQRVWRKFSSIQKLKQRKSKVKRHERKESQTRIQRNAKEHLLNLSLEYHEMTQSPNQERELKFIKLLNASDTFQAAIGLTTDSLAYNLISQNPNQTNSTAIMYQKSCIKFIQWINKILHSKYQPSANIVEILKNGNILCQIVVKLFPSTECQLLEKGLEYSIHKIIFFLEFCRCIGITGVFKVVDLVPSLIKDESNSGIMIFRTISNLENKAQNIGNWKGPFLEFDAVLKENNQNNLKISADPSKRSSLLGQFENLDVSQMHNENAVKTPNEEKRSISEKRSTSLLSKGPLARLRESRAKRVSSLAASYQGTMGNADSEENRETTSPKRELDSSQRYFLNYSDPDSSQISGTNDFSHSQEASENISDFGSIQNSKEDLQELNGHDAAKEITLLNTLPKRTASPIPIKGLTENSTSNTLPKRPGSPKPTQALRTGSSTRESIQSSGSDVEVIQLHRKVPPTTPKPSQSLRTGSSTRDSIQPTIASNDVSNRQINPIPVPVEVTGSASSLKSNSLAEQSQLALKISANEVFSTVMAHMIEFLDILAKNRKVEINRLGVNPEEAKDKAILETYNISLLTLINNERHLNESDLSYFQRLQEELAEILQYREIALSIMALHRRLTKNISGYMEETKSQNNSDPITLGNFFMNFANDMLTPYVRYAVLFFEGHQVGSEDYIQPSNPSDLENAVDFIKTYIKVEDDKKPPIERERLEQFLKFPLQRLHNYSSVLDNLIASSHRSSLDIDNRKLKIAKLKILAAFDTIKERFE